MTLSPREKLIHCGWIIAVLIFVIVLLLTNRVDQNTDLVTQIGVATGLVSLVVGVIAIVYAFVTNGALGDSSNRLEKSSKAIEDASHETIASIESIRSTLTVLAKQVSDIDSKLPLASQGSQSSQTPQPELSGPVINVNQLIDYFLNTASWFGLLTLYVAVKRHEADKPFNAYAWTSTLGGLSPDYAIGYFVSTASTGIVMYDQTRFLQQGNLWITFVFSGLSEKITQNVSVNLSRPGLSPEDISLRSTQKIQSEAYISQP